MTTTTNELKVLVLPMETNISAKAMKLLEQQNCIVIHSRSPSEVRLLHPSDDVTILPSNEFVWSALDALAMSDESHFSEPDAHKLRRRFVKNLAAATEQYKPKTAMVKNPPSLSAPAETKR